MRSGEKGWREGLQMLGNQKPESNHVRPLGSEESQYHAAIASKRGRLDPGKTPLNNGKRQAETQMDVIHGAVCRECAS